MENFLDFSGLSRYTEKIKAYFANLLKNKVDKVNGKELSTNDLTNALKQNYDSAYSHSTSIHAPTNAEKNTIVTIKQNGVNLIPDDNRIVDLGTVLTGGEQTSTSVADGGSNVYTFSDGSTITVRNGSKGSQGNPGKDGTNGTNGTSVTVASVSESDADGGNNIITFSDGTIITIKNGSKGSVGATGSAGTKGDKGDKGDDGVTPTIKAAAGTNIESVGTPTVTASTSGTTTTFTFNNLKGEKGEKGDKGDAGTNATTTAVATTSANGLMSKDDKSKLDGVATGANKTTVDSTLSSTSTNPVQNKVINTALSGKASSSHTHNVSTYTGGVNYSNAMPSTLTVGMFWIGNAK